MPNNTIYILILLFLTTCKDETNETTQLIIEAGEGVSDEDGNFYPSVCRFDALRINPQEVNNDSNYGRQLCRPDRCLASLI